MARIDNVEQWLKTGRVQPPLTAPKPEATEPPDGEVARPLEGAPDVVETGGPPEIGDADAGAAPPAAPFAKGEPENAPFREMRKLKQQIRELQERIVAAGGTPATPAVSDDLPTIDTPIEHFDARLKRLENALMQERAVNQNLQSTLSAMNQEANYRQSHPDYDKAMRYLESSEHKIWGDTGGLTALAAQMLEANEAAFEREARLRGGETAPEDIALEVARNQISVNGRNQLAEIARRTGQSVPEVIVKAARARGWNPEGEAAAAPAKAIDRVRASVERGRGESLSAMQPGNSPAPRPVIQDKEALSEFLETADPQQRAEFIQRQDAEDPRWFERIFQR